MHVYICILVLDYSYTASLHVCIRFFWCTFVVYSGYIYMYGYGCITCTHIQIHVQLYIPYLLDQMPRLLFILSRDFVR